HPPRSTLLPYTTLFRSHAARAEHRALRHSALVVERAGLGLCAIQNRHRRATGDAGLEGAAGPHPAAQLVQQVLEREPHRQLVVRSEEHTSELQSRSDLV